MQNATFSKCKNPNSKRILLVKFHLDLDPPMRRNVHVLEFLLSKSVQVLVACYGNNEVIVILVSNSIELHKAD